MQAASQVVRDPSLIGCIATSSCTGYHLPGLAVVPCDNVPHNGPWLARGVDAVATSVEP